MDKKQKVMDDAASLLNEQNRIIDALLGELTNLIGDVRAGKAFVSDFLYNNAVEARELARKHMDEYGDEIGS